MICPGLWHASDGRLAEATPTLTRPRTTSTGREPPRKRRPTGSTSNRKGGTVEKPRARSGTRLPTTIHPTTIELSFELDPRDRIFRGEARYAVQLDRRTRRIILHAADLRVSRARLRSPDGRDFVGRIETDADSETIVVRFDRLLPRGASRLELTFRGRVRNDLRGLYRSVDGDLPWIATQLCPTDARRFFPCFDEPGIKARYRIRATVPEDQTVLSNAPIEFEESHHEPSARSGGARTGRRTPKAGSGRGPRKTVHFATTPPLSAYLIAIAVGPFEASPVLMSGATEIRVHTLPGRQDLAAFAREVAAESLARLEKWFGIEHPYPKLDLLALPDFAFGAMENAGAVFFRDSILLLDPVEATTPDRKRTSEVIAHELAHMWFGNLVTMGWWNDLWLNESFATWMAYEIIDSWQPDWRIWLDFAHRRENALEIDSLASSHPIAPRIRNAREAHENFDAITYTKGASVLRMLEGYLGHEVFRQGVRLYIRRHREGTATASDLWAALSEASDLPVESIVGPWTLQTGYPLVSLRIREKNGLGTIELRQERFLSLPRRARARRSGIARPRERWTIPWVGRIGLGRGDDARAVKHLLTKRREEIPGRGAELTWIYGNAGETGFFRVEYERSVFEDLLANVQSLSPLERIGFVGHQWALVRALRVPIANLLDLIAALGTDEDPDVLFAVEGVLEKIDRRLAARAGRLVEERLRAWVAVYFGGQIDALGFEPRPGEDPRHRMRRARIISILGRFAHAESVRKACLSRLSAHLDSGVPLPTELADEIVRIGAGVGDASLHASLLDATRRATTPQTRRRMLLALAEFDGEREFRSTLRAALEATLAPAPDRAALLAALLMRPTTAEATWYHLERIWPRLEKQLPPILLARLASASAAALPPSSRAEIRAFFETHPLVAGPRVLRQIAEEMSIADRLEKHVGPRLEAYLAGA